MSIPQVRSSAYQPFVSLIEQSGASVERGLATDVIPAIVQRDAEMLVPLHLAHSYLQWGARKIGRADFGFLAGASMRIFDLGEFGRHLHRSFTLHDLLMKFGSHFSQYSSAEKIWWVRDGEDINLCHAYLQPTGLGARYAEQCALLLMRDIVRNAAGRDWQPRVVFSPDRSDAKLFRDEFDDPEFRQAGFKGFSFPAEFMSRPFDWYRSGGTVNAVQDLGAFANSVPSSDFAGALKQVIATMMSEGRCRLEQVAAALDIHPRTLERRLASLEQDYSELLAQVRFESALRLMGDPRNRLTDIAFELGFSDASNFSRTFRQWTGMKPSEFRRRRFG